MNIIINYHSLVAAVEGERSQLMVYGFSECQYKTIANTLKSSEPFGKGIVENPIKRVFTYTIANYTKKWESHTVEGREIFRINRSISSIGSICKAALVNIVIENVKRQREGLPLIPILFAIDISSDTSGRYPPSIEDVINIRKGWTFQELRRAYKLCADPVLTEEVNDVAKRTFKFVKVLVSTSLPVPHGASSAHIGDIQTTYSFESIKAPWQKDPKSWQRALAVYTEKKKSLGLSPDQLHYIKEKAESGFDWRPQVLQALRDH